MRVMKDDVASMAFVPLRDVLLRRKKELLEELYEVDLALDKAGTKQLFITENAVQETTAAMDESGGGLAPGSGLFGLPPGKAAKRLLQQENHPRTRAEIVATLMQRGAAAGSKNPERTIQRALDVNLAIGSLHASGDLIGLPEWFEHY